jgi:cellulose synthase/poly-beta-1,6-N-acetylglucosamine synthase-like glycosyltransferase
VIRRLAIVAQLPLALMVLYLDLLSLAALRRRGRVSMCVPQRRFAVLIPAHDEDATLPRLLRSLDRLQYPRALYTVHVVADNCTDHTAERAQCAGAVTHVRHDLARRGKGHALRWLLDELRHEERHDDAYVILDADSVVSSNLLSVLDAYLAQGAQAVQVYYGMLDGHESWRSALREAAFALYNGLRPRGRDALGWSAGLRGNGMCFTAALIARHGWRAFGLAEDAEFHLQLLEDGIHVRYSPEARVRAEMPATLRAARTQHQRWERGRLQLLRTHGPRLLRTALLTRDLAVLDALTEQLVPPLSVLTGLITLCFAVTGAAHWRGARHLAGAMLGGEVLYVTAGLRLAGARPRTYAALALAPLYIVWKIVLYGAAAAHLSDARWIRTPRRSARSSADGPAAFPAASTHAISRPVYAHRMPPPRDVP